MVKRQSRQHITLLRFTYRKSKYKNIVLLRMHAYYTTFVRMFILLLYIFATHLFGRYGPQL